MQGVKVIISIIGMAIYLGATYTWIFYNSPSEPVEFRSFYSDAIVPQDWYEIYPEQNMEQPLTFASSCTLSHGKLFLNLPPDEHRLDLVLFFRMDQKLAHKSSLTLTDKCPRLVSGMTFDEYFFNKR